MSLTFRQFVTGYFFFSRDVTPGDAAHYRLRDAAGRRRYADDRSMVPPAFSRHIMQHAFDTGA